MQRGRGAGILSLAVLAAALFPAAASARRAAVAASVPAYVASSPVVGAPAPNRTIHFDVALGLEDPYGASVLARRVSNPASDSFRKFVSAATFRRRFAWRRRQVRPVVRWLRSEGLKTHKPSRNRMLVPASGTVSDYERAFGTSLRTYRYGGQRLLAPSEPVSVPARLSRIVEGTLGIPEAPIHTDLASVSGPLTAEPAEAPPTTHPGPPPIGGGISEQPPPPSCSPYWGASILFSAPLAYGRRQPSAICGYVARQLRAAYGSEQLRKQKGIDGRGVRIGIVLAYLSPTLQADLDAYSDRNKIPRTRLRIDRPHRYTPADSSEIWGAYGEQTLDVEVSHGMAPGARIRYAGADGLNAALAAENELVGRNKVDVISNSYGGIELGAPPTEQKAAKQVFDEAAAQGITILYSSGDSGDYTATDAIRTVAFPASARRVTAVGGTTLAVGPRNQRMWEQGWGESTTALDDSTGAWDPAPPGEYHGGSTGGTSRLFSEPHYQRSKVPRQYSGYYGGHARVVPDIGLVGDPMSGPMVMETAIGNDGQPLTVKYSIGGTSVSSPVFAGAVATMIDKNGGARLGFLNPALYKLGKRAIRPVGRARRAVAVFRRYANGENADDGYKSGLITGGVYNTLRVRRGYDDVTGLGSPNIPPLARGLDRLGR